MIQSSGILTKTPDINLWQGTPSTWPHQLDLGFRWASYSAIYRSTPFVAALVNKIANATARLPLKVYERGDNDERHVLRDHPYAEILRHPNPLHDPFLFWVWTISTLNIYGEAFWGKVRDRGDRPVELVPLHPTNITSTENSDGKVTWAWDNGTSRIDNIARRDLVHFKFYNPDSLTRGMSPLEPLRSTLENETGARAANSAMWRNGGRPSVMLKHPKTLSDGASNRIKAQWDEIHGGVDNWAKTAVLEEGMDATVLTLNVEELQYIESRKFNREEYCAVYDVPPPAVHILDRATFSNIVEQMRSLYRDTMATKLGFVESTLDMELRDGRMGDRNRKPDFSEGVYAEFLMDEVLRGDFEVRVPAMAQAIQTGQMTPNEGRKIENRPPVDGGDVLLVNSALVSLEQVGQPVEEPAQPALEPPQDDEDLADVIPIRSVMGRLARQKSLDEIDPEALCVDLNGLAPLVLEQLVEAKAAGESVIQFRERIKALGGTT